MTTTEVFPAEPGRLDAVLAEALGVPRAEAQRAIAEGRVLVDGESRPKSHRLGGGERIVADLPEAGALQAEEGTVPVLLEDDDLMVVSKPAGLVSHPSQGRRTGTLVNVLLGMGKRLAASDDPDRPGIVHRLDAGTSGLMLVAKSERARQALTEMLRRHEVTRRYLTLVRGRVRHDLFVVDAPLERRRARIVLGPVLGREATTEVEVLERLARATLLEARPRTGRTHQIRVHLSSVGHPILGDRAYGGGGEDAAALGLDRPFLHSAAIAFDHPFTGDHVELEDPLPDDLSRALDVGRGQP